MRDEVHHSSNAVTRRTEGVSPLVDPRDEVLDLSNAVTAQNTVRRRPSVAVWTPDGRGAVATIRAGGDLRLLAGVVDQLFHAANGRSLAGLPIGALCFGGWGRETSENVVVCRTDEEVVEIHSHGGAAAVQRILTDLMQRGCETVDWSEQCQSATSILVREHAAALSRATTVRAAAWIATQAGQFERAISNLADLLVRGEWTALQQAADQILRWAKFGLHLTRPWTVVLAGRPNVGKSSLINALLGFERSIVFDQPGTTRDVLTAETVLDGWPIRLQDTAGLRGSDDELESAGISRARSALADADCPVILIDVSQLPQPDDLSLLSAWSNAILVGHKSDLPDVWGFQLPPRAIRVSSLRGTGLRELSSEIIQQLVPELPSEESVIPLTERQVDLLSRAQEASRGGDPSDLAETLRALIGRDRARGQVF
jgi:tRNA modification GTPase